MRFLFIPLLFLPLTAQAQSCNGPCQGRAAEPHFLKAGLAERRDNRLILTTGSGTRVFTDNRKACDSGAAGCAVYVLAARAPNSLVVRKFESEGSDCYLIDARSGKSTLLTGVPVFSPDGQEFLVTEFSNDSDNNLEMWRRAGDGARLEWAHPFRLAYAEDPQLREMYEARVVSWSGDRIALALTGSDGKQHWAGSLTRDAGGWHLAAKSPPALLPRRE